MYLRWSGATARGRVDGTTITLNLLLTQSERRSTLAHELVHLERGPVLQHLRAREEVIVEAIAARRLVDRDDLVDAIVWHDGIAHSGTAEDLWADRAILLARIQALTDQERAYIEQAVDRQERTP